MRSAQTTFEDLGLCRRGAEIDVESLPFSSTDITAGSESEMQTVVVGARNSVDLPLQIERSNFYANVSRHIAAGDTPRRVGAAIERYLNDNREQVWENSWARFPERLLSEFARQTFQADLLADKRDHRSGLRSDLDRFVVREGGETLTRIPVSYLLKLALAEILGSQPNLPRAISVTGVKLLGHFLNDNTSPETFSFYVTLLRPEKELGRELAREKAKRFLLSYNHTPVAGVVRDFYEVRGRLHACNPSAVVTEVTPYSKNTRTVTVIDTDVEGGSQVGLVAMIEVTALMIGDVAQCYSRERYDSPRPITVGMFVERGCPKSLYRPGSSTDVLLFQRGRVAFDEDLIDNMRRHDAQSRFSQGFGRPLVETEVTTRSRIAMANSNKERFK